VVSLAWLLFLRFHPPTHHKRELHGHRHHQVQSLRPRGIAHFGLFPMETSPLMVFVLILHPEPHLIPRRLCLSRQQIGDDR
jgi:hypothetical protein